MNQTHQYAELPTPNLPRGGFPDLFTAEQMRDFADHTHVLRMEQATPKAAQTWPSEALVWEALQAYLKHDTNMEGMRAALIMGASSRGLEDSELLKTAARNLKYFIEHAQFSSFADKQAALNCLDALGAPPQEAQGPALFVSPKQLAALTDPDDPEGEHGRYLPARKTGVGLFTQPLYTAPQPAPAPLSDDAKDAARLDWLALAGPTSICVVIDRPHDGEVEVATDDVTGYGKTLREALDAARKQAAPKAAPGKACVCGESQAPGTVHRVDGPCYVATPQQEEPTDAEIIALAISEGIKVRTGASAVKLVRAALAKWCTPQPAP